MKFKHIISIALLLSSLSFAETKYPFWGVVGYSSDIDGDSGAVAGIRYGQQSRDWRTSFTLESKYQNQQLFTVQIDRTLLYSLSTSKLRVYGGIIGAAIAQDKDDGSSDKNLGYGYGLSAGLMFYLSDKVDLDLGVRYIKVTDLDHIDEIKSVGFAMHYFF
ncbi:MAG: hypothetical protein U9N49_06865 [Campylobacterota bacterium]|nr:hypothetical protein [Campylobacterota bacterium]